MAVKRYSGSLTITLRYDDRNFYPYSISREGKVLAKGVARPAPAGFGQGIAYDSPRAFDEMAHAALSFGDADNHDVGEAAAYDAKGEGWLILRKKPARKAMRNGRKRAVKWFSDRDIAAIRRTADELREALYEGTYDGPETIMTSRGYADVSPEGEHDAYVMQHGRGYVIPEKGQRIPLRVRGARPNGARRNGHAYGTVPVETVNGVEYVWLRQIVRGRAPAEHRVPVLKVTPTHVVVETLHTGIVVRSVPEDRFGYRPIRISRKTGRVVGVTEHLTVLPA